MAPESNTVSILHCKLTLSMEAESMKAKLNQKSVLHMLL